MPKLFTVDIWSVNVIGSYTFKKLKDLLISEDSCSYICGGTCNSEVRIFLAILFYSVGGHSNTLGGGGRQSVKWPFCFLNSDFKALRIKKLSLRLKD